MALIKASTICTDALGILGVYGPGTVIPGEDMNTALARLNDMLDNWNTNRLFVYTVQEFTNAGVFPTLPAGGNTSDGWQTLTIGPGATINVTERPTKMEDYGYVIFNNVSYPLTQINREQWTSITLKNQTSSYPNFWYYDAEYPIATLYFWPVSTQSTELHLSYWQEFGPFSTLGASTQFPQGYSMALKYSLAEILQDTYRVPLSASAMRMARKTRSDVKRMNRVTPVLSLRQELTGKRSTFNIYTGE